MFSIFMSVVFQDVLFDMQSDVKSYSRHFETVLETIACGWLSVGFVNKICTIC